jgi:hypothetical protein
MRWSALPELVPGRIATPEASERSNRCKSNPAKDLHPESVHKRLPFDPNLRHDTCQTDPDLAAVIDAWGRLPEAVRAGIAAMVKAASGR